MYEKKGSVKDGVTSTVGLIAGVGVAVLVLVFVGTLGGQTYQLVEPDIDAIGIYSGSTTGLTVLNSTAKALSHTALQSTPLAYKAGTLITGNFTYNLERGTATLIDNANNNTAFNFTYTWKNETISSNIKNGILSSFNALEQTGSYLPLIVLAFVIALVLALVLGMNLGNNNSGGNSAL